VLTADLVNARRKGNELRLVPLGDDGRARATEVAAQMIERVTELTQTEGASRKDVDDTLAAVEAEARDQRLKAGLAKLLVDRCTFEAEPELDPEMLRREVWERAAIARKAGQFDRAQILAAVAEARKSTPAEIDRALFSDLRAAHLLLGFQQVAASALVRAYEHGQAQAVLLRATKIVVDVVASPGPMRALFHKLKFLRLLHVVEKTKEGHRITIDGPFALFESATKYGLELAMVLPALEGAEEWKMEANVLWGKERKPLTFRLEGAGDKARAGGRRAASFLSDEVKELAAAIESMDPTWSVRPGDAILELPGIGLCVPDLVFTREGTCVYFESMGYWSRDAVWRRVELVLAGLTAPIVFAVSKRLRVSEEVLPEEVPAALYVYKGTMHPRAILDRVEKLWKR
jgi:hypothetical protein